MTSNALSHDGICNDDFITNLLRSPRAENSDNRHKFSKATGKSTAAFVEMFSLAVPKEGPVVCATHYFPATVTSRQIIRGILAKLEETASSTPSKFIPSISMDVRADSIICLTNVMST